jgi:hypothetical protein
MIGGGAAALTGLMVVAMSLHLEVIAADPQETQEAQGLRILPSLFPKHETPPRNPAREKVVRATLFR